MTSADVTATSIPVRNDDVLFSKVADGMSLMDIESGKYYHYDETGAAIWSLIDGQASIERICEELVRQFDVDVETCRKDTVEFLGELSGHGLIGTTKSPD